MHLKNRPTYFVKNGVRKPVYYTVDARQLIENGWTEEGGSAAPEPVKVTGIPIPITSPEPVKVEENKTTESKTEVDLDGMTRAELVEFAESNDIEFKSYASKADILEACKEFVDG
jgi:hypothetical protein